MGDSSTAGTVGPSVAHGIVPSAGEWRAAERNSIRRPGLRQGTMFLTPALDSHPEVSNLRVLGAQAHDWHWSVDFAGPWMTTMNKEIGLSTYLPL